jgi:apolipoprotein D and lipocalin family protein
MHQSRLSFRRALFSSLFSGPFPSLLLSPMAPLLRWALALLGVAAVHLQAQAQANVAVPPPAPPPIPSVDLNRYAGTWHQVALYPNRFQSQCVRDTSAHYALGEGGQVVVTNRCRKANGEWEEVVGAARPRDAMLSGTTLSPASLEVAFAPAWLRWLPQVWGRYQVVHLETDYSLSIVSEPTREFLWVLSRTPQLSAGQWADVKRRLVGLGFDLGRLQGPD